MSGGEGRGHNQDKLPFHCGEINDLGLPISVMCVLADHGTKNAAKLSTIHNCPQFKKDLAFSKEQKHTSLRVKCFSHSIISTFRFWNDLLKHIFDCTGLPELTIRKHTCFNV